MFFVCICFIRVFNDRVFMSEVHQVECIICQEFYWKAYWEDSNWCGCDSCLNCKSSWCDFRTKRCIICQGQYVTKNCDVSNWCGCNSCPHCNGPACFPTILSNDRVFWSCVEITLYRVMNNNDLKTIVCSPPYISSKNPNSRISIEDHILQGQNQSSYISCSLTFEASKKFARGKKSRSPFYIIEFKVVFSQIMWDSRKAYHLAHLKSSKARNFSRKFQEVLLHKQVRLKGHKKIYSIN
jgi:hypothetical protein